MSFEIDSDSVQLSLRRSEVEHIIQALIFQKEYYIENVEEDRITQIEDGFCAMSATIQRLLDDMECLGRNHRSLIMEFKEQQGGIDRRLDNLENKLLQSGEDVCITIEKFSAMIRKELYNFDSIYKRVDKKVIKSEGLKNTGSYDEISSFGRKSNTTPNDSVPLSSPSETIISEDCIKSSGNSIISFLNVRNISNSNSGKDINTPYSPLKNSEINTKMESAGNFKLKSAKNNDGVDELKSKRFVMEGLETCKTEFRNSYRFSGKVDVEEKQDKQPDDLNESSTTYHDLIYNDENALYYQYKRKFLLKYLYNNKSAREMSDLTYRILFDRKERSYLLVIEKEKMDNSKIVFKINGNFKFYLIGDYDVYCECANEDPDPSEEKMWMMSFDNKNDSKEFYDRVINIQAKK
uniref:PH domain-containing protein n=1 Tax=Strongyloides papillosus TaxID=174720 RepID=A0A0N5BRR5_STREA